MRRPVGIVVGLTVITAAFAAPATAQLQLIYNGPAFTDFYGSVTGPGNVTAVVNLDQSITALTQGLLLGNADVTSFSFSSLGRTIDSGNTTFSFFQMLIGSSLLPEEWNIAAEANLEAGPEPEQIASNHYKDHFGIDDLQFPNSFSGAYNHAAFTAGFASGPSNWTVNETVIPEPTTLALFGLGLVGVGVMRRRKR